MGCQNFPKNVSYLLALYLQLFGSIFLYSYYQLLIVMPIILKFKQSTNTYVTLLEKKYFICFSEVNFQRKKRENYTGVCFQLAAFDNKLQARTETNRAPRQWRIQGGAEGAPAPPNSMKSMGPPKPPIISGHS